MSETPVAFDTTPLEVNLCDVHLTREPLDPWTSLSTQKPGHQEPIRTTPPSWTWSWPDGLRPGGGVRHVVKKLVKKCEILSLLASLLVNVTMTATCTVSLALLTWSQSCLLSLLMSLLRYSRMMKC